MEGKWVCVGEGGGRTHMHEETSSETVTIVLVKDDNVFKTKMMAVNVEVREFETDFRSGWDINRLHRLDQWKDMQSLWKDMRWALGCHFLTWNNETGMGNGLI